MTTLFSILLLFGAGLFTTLAGLAVLVCIRILVDWTASFTNLLLWTAMCLVFWFLASTCWVFLGVFG